MSAGAARSRPRLLLVVGARPNFVKAAPVHRAAAASGRFDLTLVHTGQHYDEKLSDHFFRDLEMPAADLHLGVGSGSHAKQTAAVMRRIEPILIELEPAAVLVFGDVNSTVAAALTAAKLEIPVAHVEAGLRSFDRAMPEELNRIVTDALSDLLFTTEESGNANLEREGVAAERVHFVGNTMVDSLLQSLEESRRLRPEVASRLGVGGRDYALVTLHRPSNVDRPEVLAGLCGAFERLGRRLPVLFPAHPRTRARLADAGLEPGTGGSFRLLQPLAYLEFLALLDGARLVLTDSGGIQEETTALGVDCLTLRDNTERPVTITHGTNRLAGSDPEAVVAAAERALAKPRAGAVERPPLWDGRAAERIVEVLAARFAP